MKAIPNLYNKIISPIVTEKSTNQSEQNKIVFKVYKNFNKKLIKKNVEKIFKVEVVKVNILNKRTKIKSTRGRKWKKTKGWREGRKEKGERIEKET